MPSDSEKILSLVFTMGRRMRDEGHGKRRPAHSMLHFQTLRYVQENGNPPMHAVARHLCVTPPAATLLIEGLVKDKLIARAVDTKDRRTVRVTLTDEGKKLIARSIREKAGKLKKMFSVLTAKERAALIGILKKLS